RVASPLAGEGSEPLTLPSAAKLADSHIFERAPGLGDAEEVFHAAPHGYGAWLGSRVAVPPAEPGDDPSGPGEAFGWMRVGLQRCPAPVFRSERGEELDLLLVEGAAGRLGAAAVAGLDELQCYDGGLGGDCGELEQSIGGFQ